MLNYIKFNVFMISVNFESTLINLLIINLKFIQKFFNNQSFEVKDYIYTFILLFLGLVL